MWPYIILAVIALAIVITAIKAAFFVPKKKDYGTPTEEKVDAKKAQANLSKAISIPTISYPDKSKVDFGQFEKFHKFLEEAYPLVHKNLTKEVVQEASLIFRWKGTRDDLEPIALLAHQDVVPISEGTEQDWTYAPFSGYNDGEFIWGRGALDMKNHLVAVMDAVETLLEEGFQPERDVYLLFGQDEEVVASESGGAKNIMLTLKERGIHLDSVLDEGGAIIPVNVKGILNNKELVGIGVAEKGYTDFEITVNAKGGHSSQPPVHSGLGKLANVIKDLENNQFKAELLPFVKELFSNIGRNCTYPARLIMCNLKLFHPLLKFIMKKIPFAACLIRTTTAVTMAQGSPAANVLPQKSTVTVNFRQMPGTTVKDVENHIRKVCRNKDIEVKVLKAKEASKFSPTDSRTFKIIEEICMQDNKDSIVAPYLVMGGTDACYYEPICENIYRYAPYKVSVSLLRCTHGTNERIPVDTVASGVAFFKRYIRKASAE
ncbi:MAG: M20/M25/M40 family metallo-hydrolase [Ruminococcaceae bacterium]|nr:M20/M25/M40 family metallo-hydrolase [Oscillospiraceae bacterium]